MIPVRTPLLLAAVAALAASGCAAARLQLTPEEYALMARGRGAMAVVKADPARPDPGSVLRRRATAVAPDDVDLTMLLDRMRATLAATGGVGLAAPQIGVGRRVVLVMHGTRPKGQPTRVEAYLNPRVEWAAPDLDDDWEACLSIDGVGGLVPRAKRITVSFDPLGGGVRQTLELEGWDARIMQHELDHLDGVLFVDKVKGPLVPLAEARARRDAGHRARGWLPPDPAAPAATQPASAPAAR